tara:strand:+ start:856 stop:1065 length:210 start_codon:yes stop_codon:yes gene_type:complete
MIKLAILDYEKGKLHTYNEDCLNKLGYTKDWKDEFYCDSEGIEGFISCVLDFSLNNIHYMEYTEEKRNE